MLTIKQSLDWPSVESELRKLGNMMPMFNHDTRRFINRIGEMVSELSKLEVEARRTHSKYSIDRCKHQADRINEELKQVHKIHLMSVLSR